MSDVKPQVGEYWRQRCGDVVGPLRTTPDDSCYSLFDGTIKYLPGGRQSEREDVEHWSDLISRVHLLTDAEHAEWERMKAELARQDEEIKVLKELVSPTSLDADLAAEEKPISPTMLRHYRKAAHDIGGLFAWSAQYLSKFPPPPGKEWLDEIKERLLAGAQSPAPPVPEVIEGRGQPLEVGSWYLLERGSGETSVFEAMPADSSMTAHFGCRYIKLTLPEFTPPRPTFVAPPKPELVLVRPTRHNVDDYPAPFWAAKTSDGFYTNVDTGEHSEEHRVEVVNPETGEVIA